MHILSTLPKTTSKNNIYIYNTKNKNLYVIYSYTNISIQLSSHLVYQMFVNY